MDVGRQLGVDHSAVDLDSFLLELFTIRVERIVWILGLAVHLVVKLLLVAAIFLAAALGEPRPVIFHVKLDATKLDDVSSAQLVVEVILGRFGVADDHEHLVVDILVRDWVAILISWSVSHEGVVLDLEVTIGLAHNYHRFGSWIDILWLSANRNKLDIVIDPENFSASLCLDIFLGYILRLVIEKPMRVPGPSDAPHIHLVLGQLLIFCLLHFGRSFRHDLLHVVIGLKSSMGIAAVLNLDG